MNNSLVKLSLISMLALGANNALANPNDNAQENANEEASIYIEIEHVICPDEPRCPDLTQLEEDDQ